jgi:hypothetical protein
MKCRIQITTVRSYCLTILFSKDNSETPTVILVAISGNFVLCYSHNLLVIIKILLEV